MSKPIQLLPPGYYPLLLPPVLAAIPAPNSVRRYVQFWQQIYTPTSILPTNPQSLSTVSVQMTTQVAQSTFWRFPLSMPTSHYIPPAPLLNLPVLPQPPAAATQAPASANPTYPPPKKLKFSDMEKEIVNPKPQQSRSLPMTLEETEKALRTRIDQGITLMEQQKYSESIQLFRQAFSIASSPIFFFSFIPACQQIVKQIRPQILQYVEAALTKNPNDPNALLLEGLCHIRPGVHGIALRAFKSIIIGNPNDHMVKLLFKEVSLMHNRDVLQQAENDSAQKASVKKRMAVSALLVDEDTTEEEQGLPKAVIKKNT